MLLLLQPDRNFYVLELVMGWTITILLGCFALAIIYKMIQKDKETRIDLRYLIAGADGDASLSRFQFLIFTFVIAMGLFLIIISGEKGPAFPPIPGSILALLGISGGSYVTSKAVDANAPDPNATKPPSAPAAPPAPPAAPPPNVP